MIARVTKVVFVSAILIGAVVAAQKEIVIVVNKDSPISSLSVADIKRLYTGKLSEVDGQKMVPVNQTLDSEAAGAFLTKFTGMNSTQYKEYWVAQQVKGGGTAPMIQKTPTNVRLMVSQLPGGIGYVYADEADSTVKVVPIK